MESRGAGRILRIYMARSNSRLIGIVSTAWPQAAGVLVVLLGDEHAEYTAILIAANAPGAFRHCSRPLATTCRAAGVIVVRCA